MHKKFHENISLKKNTKTKNNNNNNIDGYIDNYLGTHETWYIHFLNQCWKYTLKKKRKEKSKTAASFRLLCDDNY